MSTRKYVTEGCLHMLCGKPVLTQHQMLNRSEFKELAESMPFHIYMICRRPRITFDRDSFKLNGASCTARFVVHTRDGQVSVPITSPASPGAKIPPIQCDYPHNQVAFLDDKGTVLKRIHAANMMLSSIPYLDDAQHAKYLDFEILYVGQAYGEDGARTAPDRLKSHETLLKIYSELSAKSPTDEIWLILLSFEPPFLLMSIDPTETTSVTDEDKLQTHVLGMMSDPVNERQRICFAEAALIRYLQPHYNNIFKNNFPSPAHSTYSQCYDVDLNAVSVEVQFSDGYPRVYTATVPPTSQLMIRYDLHDREQRKSMFEGVFVT